MLKCYYITSLVPLLDLDLDLDATGGWARDINALAPQSTYGLVMITLKGVSDHRYTNKGVRQDGVPSPFFIWCI